MLLTLSAAFLLGAAQAPVPAALTPVNTRDQKIVRRWSLAGEPRGIAVAKDGTIYLGLAQSQAVIAVDPKSGTIVRKAVLDSAEIAATKELVTLRVNADSSRLYVANGSDESATILSLPDLGVVREITIEGEAIRDAVPDPAGRYLYIVGRRVHVYDINGEKELHTLAFADPAAVAVGRKHVAVLGSYDFGSAKATGVAVYDTTAFREPEVEPLQTSEAVEAALFTPDEGAIVAISKSHLFEKPLVTKAKAMTTTETGQLKMSAGFGDLVNSNSICLPEHAGAQVMALGPDNSVVFAETRCGTTASITGSSRRVTPVSLYGVEDDALALDPLGSTIAAADRSGYLTIYKVPARVPRERPSHGR